MPGARAKMRKEQGRAEGEDKGVSSREQGAQSQERGAMAERREERERAES